VKEIANFKERIKHCAANFKNSRCKEVVLIHHNDTDGLSAGTILLAALEREKITVRRYALEKPYPMVLERLFCEDGVSAQNWFMLTDFASGMLPEISRINAKRHNVLVLDHHTVSPVKDEKIHLLNGLEFGLTSKHFSSSSACFEFALALNGWNCDLAWLGALGALGDGFFEEGKLAGLNAEVWERVTADGQGRFDGEYIFRVNLELKAARLIECIDALGSIGYLRGGPDIAVKGLRDGPDEILLSLADDFTAERDEKFNQFLTSMKLEQTPNIQWFDLKDSFHPMGVKTVGLLCAEVAKRQGISEHKYIAGFQHIAPSIPGLGDFPFKQSKISMRAPPMLRNKIECGMARALSDLLPQAAREVDGFVDACHPSAAAAAVLIGQERELIAAMERILATASA